MPGRILACPRCGYDLSGQADAARQTGGGGPDGPGVCSECGLEFDWADVLDPWRARVRGFVEHDEGWMFPAVWRTWMLALRPWRFWSRVRVEMALRPGRIMLWLVLGPVLLWAAGSLAAELIELQLPAPFRPSPLEAVLRYWVEPDDKLRYGSFGSLGALGFLRDLPAAVTGPLAAGLVIPIVLVFLPSTRRLAKIRVSHILRATVYGFAWILPALVIRGGCRVVSAIEEVDMHMRARPGWMAPLPPGDWFRMARQVVELTHLYWLVWLAVFMGWIMLWWWSALRVGWKVKEHKRVFWALMIPAWLGAAVAVALSHDGYRMFV